MGYVEKKELMEKLNLSGLFTDEEIHTIDELIETDRINDNDSILKLSAINVLEGAGLLKRFYDVCKQNKFFPVWLENIEKGKDTIINV